MGTRIATVLVACALTGAPASVLAEVADKLGSPARFWAYGVVGGVIAFALCWRWPRMAIVLVPLLAALVWGSMSGNADVNAAYRLEIGEVAYRVYRAHLFTSTAVMPIGAVLGSVLSLRIQQRHVT